MSKQSLIGLVLMFLVLLGFSYWQTSKMEKQREAAAAEYASQQSQTDDFSTGTGKPASFEAGDNPAAQASTQNGNAVKSHFDASHPFSAAAEGQEQHFQIENEVYTLDFNTKGGRISGITLKEYLTYKKEDLVLFDENRSDFYLQFFAQNRNIRTDRYYFECLMPQTTKVEGNDSVEVRMRLYPNGAGIDTATRPLFDKSRYIEFVYTIRGNQYMMGFDVNFVNTENLIASNTSFIDMVWNARLERLEKPSNTDMEGMNSSVYYKPSTDKVQYLKGTRDDEEELTTPSRWISFKQQFFNMTLIADNEFPSADIRNYKRRQAAPDYLKDMEAVIGIPYTGEADQSFGMQLYAGPNKFRILRDYNLDLERLIPLGWGFFLIQWINRVAVIPIFDFLEAKGVNYGIIILILTILLKIVISPMTYKSYASSAKMRVIQPEIAELNKKYPKQEQAMEKQKAMMTLYKRAGISPMAGCIPMLLQLPIIYAMFRFFPASIELRQQSFLWADDLSSYDSILNLPFNIPWYGDHVSLFALTMALSNLLYTHMTMKSQVQANPMPGMKFMMYIMPIMFLFFLNNYSSALNYYYTLSSLMTFLQMFLIRKMINDEKVLAQIQENKKKPVKKSRFQARLEEMAKRQQEIARQQAQQRRR